MKTTLLAKRITRESATSLLREAVRIGQSDAKQVGAALARDVEIAARKVLTDCIVAPEVRAEATQRVEMEALELTREHLAEPPAAQPPAPPPPFPLHETRRSRVRAAVRLVTSAEARARARGFEVDQSPARADHAIALAVRGNYFCTVSALAGDVYVDGVGPAPLQRVSLAWDEAAGVHFATQDPACPDPLAAIELEIALLLRAASAHGPAAEDNSFTDC